MANGIIKQISIYDGSTWQTDNIGVDAGNITLSSSIAGSNKLQNALTSILPSDKLNANYVVITDDNRKLKSSDISTTQLSHLSGVTSNIQAQINGKAPTTHATTATTYGRGTTQDYGHVKIINSLSSTAYAQGESLAAYQGYVLNNNFKNYATTSTLSSCYATKAALNSYATISTLSSCYATKAALNSYATTSALNNYAKLSNIQTFSQTLGSSFEISPGSTGACNVLQKTFSDAGTYIIVGTVAYLGVSGGVSKYRDASLATVSKGSNLSTTRSVGIDSGNTLVQTVWIGTLTANQTVYLTGRSANRTTIMKNDSSLQAIRIK